MSSSHATVAARPAGLFARIGLMGTALAIVGPLSILLVVVIARYFIATAIAGIPDDFIGPVVFIGGPGLFALLFAIVFLVSLGDRALVFPCPACGDERARRVSDDLAQCKACLAWCRAAGMQVAEEQPARSSADRPYRVTKAQLAGRGRLEAAACCAVCGADEVTAHGSARYQRAKSSRDVKTGLEGGLDLVTGYSAVSVTEHARRGDYSPSPSPKDPLRVTLGYGLCRQHAHAQDAVLFDDDELQFRNYRCYRDTLRANGLGRAAA